MAKVKVEVLDAVVDGKGKGSQLSVEEKTADYLESIRYVKRVETKSKSNKSEDKD